MRNELNTMVTKKFQPDYKKAAKKEKTKMLNQLQKITELERKHLIKALNGQRPIFNHDKPGRPSLYKEISEHVLKLHGLMNEVSSKRMKAALPIWIPFYQKHFSLFDQKLKKKLLSISSSSIERILRKARKREKGKSSTSISYKMQSLIPLKRLDEKVTKPGIVQGDTVAHFGSSLSGTFAYTLTTVDLFSSWTENRAHLGKDSSEIKKRLIDIEKTMPIGMRCFDTDCGSEFLNYRIMRYFSERKKKVQMRRARPYKKNDQSYVEQRNFTHVRNLFGYERIENEELVKTMNKIYKEYWNPLHNYFLPSFKLKEKVRKGSRIKKIFDKPKTPAQRLLEAKGFPSYLKEVIKYNMKKLDPIELKRALEKEIDVFYKQLERSKKGLTA